MQVRIASGRPSHEERSVGDRVDMSRLVLFKTLANSGSVTQQPSIRDAGVLAAGVADGLDEPFAQMTGRSASGS